MIKYFNLLNILMLILVMFPFMEAISQEEVNEINLKEFIQPLSEDGSFLIPDRMERPFIFVEDDIPKVLNLAVKKGNDSYTVFIPLEEVQ